MGKRNNRQTNKSERRKPTAWSYVRVSTMDQNVDRQIDAMHRLGMDDAHIFQEKRSGKDFDRPEYRKMCNRLQEGDVLYIHSIDRLGRNYTQIREEWRKLTKEKKINIVVMDMPLLDTRKFKDLIGTLISDLVLELLAYVAETERESIRKRTVQGLEAARSRGASIGRPRLTFDEEFQKMYIEWKNGKISLGEAAKKVGVSKQTLHYRIQVYESRVKKKV